MFNSIHIIIICKESTLEINFRKGNFSLKCLYGSENAKFVQKLQKPSLSRRSVNFVLDNVLFYVNQTIENRFSTKLRYDLVIYTSKNRSRISLMVGKISLQLEFKLNFIKCSNCREILPTMSEILDLFLDV